MKKMLWMTLCVCLLAGAGAYWWVAKKTTQPELNAAKPLFYRNPMNPEVTSPVPQKDQMGMDYIPVYQTEAKAEGGLSISAEKVQKLGVQSEAVAYRTLDKTLRAAGRVEIDERGTFTIAPKFEGWIERLHVNATGQSVVKGQPLFEVYSPELTATLREYALAQQAALQHGDAGMQQLAQAGMARLKNWGISEAQIAQGANAGRNLTFYAPATGIVLEKKALQGMRFMPGEVLYQVADLSKVWVLCDVAEQDIAQLKPGSKVTVFIEAYPEQHFSGKLDFVYPTLNQVTRTVAVRVEINNPKGLLKPSMYARVELSAAEHAKVLTVPLSAVIDSGARQVALVQLQQGHFEARTLRTGQRSDSYVEILEGLQEGEQVVTRALFLLDSESNLKAALSGLAAAEQKPEQAKSVGHQVLGVLNALNPDGTVNITHEPVPDLDWPGMTMDFLRANPSLGSQIKSGTPISFEIVMQKPDTWVITRLEARNQGGH